MGLGWQEAKEWPERDKSEQAAVDSCCIIESCQEGALPTYHPSSMASHFVPWSMTFSIRYELSRMVLLPFNRSLFIEREAKRDDTISPNKLVPSAAARPLLTGYMSLNLTFGK